MATKEPYENYHGEGEEWKRGGLNPYDSMRVGLRYILTRPQIGSAMKVVYRDNKHFILDPKEVKLLKPGVAFPQTKAFKAGIFMGQPFECKWLPEVLKKDLEQSPHPIGLFCGVPENEKQEYLFFNTPSQNPKGAEFVEDLS
jgi:hypothetical protein